MVVHTSTTRCLIHSLRRPISTLGRTQNQYRYALQEHTLTRVYRTYPSLTSSRQVQTTPPPLQFSPSSTSKANRTSSGNTSIGGFSGTSTRSPTSASQRSLTPPNRSPPSPQASSRSTSPGSSSASTPSSAPPSANSPTPRTRNGRTSPLAVLTNKDDSDDTCVLEKQWARIAAIETWSRKPIRPMTMKQLLETTSYSEKAVLAAAEWVRSELPIRLAHRLFDFHRLPFAVVSNPHIKETYATYARTFDAMLRFGPLTSIEEETEFEKVLMYEKNEHDRTVDLMGKGIQQLKHVLGDPVNLDTFLERFFFFRIGRRIMIDHLVSIQHPVEGWAGCFNLSCSPATIAKQRAEEVRESCRVSYGIAPLYSIVGNTQTTFSCVPDHFSLIITEVLKNAMRATVEFYTLGNSLVDETQQGLIIHEEEFPEVTIEIYKGRSEVLIRVSDKGGGIPPHKMQDIWSFGYTTVGRSSSTGGMAGALGGCFVRPDMAGYGFGLPLSRAFARYFGGDIHIVSHFGVGTDVYVTMNHIGDQKEALFFEEREDLKATHEQAGGKMR